MDDKSFEKRDDNFLDQKDRRDFLKYIGNIAIPTITFLGFGTFRSKIIERNNSSGYKNEKSSGSMDCQNSCSGSCDGNCKGDCMAGCKGDCDGGCKSDCDGSCRGDCSGSSQ